jgi:hypothetical protein
MKTFLNKRWFQAGLACLILTASAGASYGQVPYTNTFNSTADTTNWVDAGQNVTVTSSFIAGDAPPGQVLSTGALGWTGTFDNAGHNFGGLRLSFPSVDLTVYTDLQFDVKIEGGADQYGQIQSLQPTLGLTALGTWDNSSIKPLLATVVTNSGWQHIDIPLNTFTNGSRVDVRQLMLLVYDGNYLASTSMQLAFDNIQFTGTAVSGLTFWANTFNSPDDVTNWTDVHQTAPVTWYFVPGDAPPGGPSTGCMQMSSKFYSSFVFKYEMAYRWWDTANPADTKYYPPNLTNYNTLEFDLKVGTNGAGQLSPLDSLGYNCQGWYFETVVNNYYGNNVGAGPNPGLILTNTSANNGWSHFKVSAASLGYTSGYFGGTQTINGTPQDITNFFQLDIYPHDTYFAAGGQTVYYKISNIKFTGPGANSIYSGLTSPTITYGASSMTLSGTVSDGSGHYLPSNAVVNVTINGSMQSTNIYDFTGDFTINYSLASLPASATPYTVTYWNPSDNVMFSAGTNTSTTLTFNKLAVVLYGTRAYDATATANASILSVVNIVGADSLTLSGSVTLASANVGTQAITSFGGLTLGGASAAGYTLVGASGSVAITASAPVTPKFSGLTSPSINYGASSMTLSGIVSTNGTYPPSGTVITVTINGSAQQTTISGSTGNFSINYNTTGLPASTYTVTYSSAVAAGFNAASDTSSTLTVNKRPVVLTGTGVYNATTNAASAYLSVADLVGSDSVTLSGSVGLASGNVGLEAITSSGALTLGGPRATNYTAVGASGSVMITPATLTYVTTAANQNFGSANTNFTGTVTGFLGIDTQLSATTGTLAFTSTTTSTSLGTWAITGSGLSAINYTFVQVAGNTTALTITVCGGTQVAGLTNYVGIYNSDADTAGWITGAGAAIGYFYADAPAGGPSTGCLMWEATFGGSNPAFQGIQTNLPVMNVRNYSHLEMDIKDFGPYDQYGQIQGIQVNLQLGATRYQAPDIQLNTSSNSVWLHYSISMSAFPGDLTVEQGLILNIYDGNYSSAIIADIGFANIKFTGQGVVPVFSGLTSKTIATGSASVALTGKVSACGTAYLPSNTVVTVTINGNKQTTAISDSTGDFSINYNTTGLANGTYPVTYSNATDNVVFTAATDANTTLTVTSLVPPTILPVYRDATGTNLMLRVATQNGYNYYLLSTTNLAPPVVWSTNSITAGTGGTITNLVPIRSGQPDLFLTYRVQ